ncbi:MAG: hypothetical protein AB1429_15655 [Pseudomonadota bacterium]
MKWDDLAFKPDAETSREASEQWAWLIGEPSRFLLSSMFGDLFFEKQNDGVYRLDCGSGAIERVAEDADAFDQFLGGERNASWRQSIDNWFLPAFVEQLHAAGKKPGLDQCFGLTILPIFEGGKYVVENVFVLPRREWISYTGALHRQIRDLPDGAKVQLVVDP